MKEIPLTQGKVAIVDDEDYEWLMQWKWRYLIGSTNGRAVRSDKINGRYVTIYMHREIVPGSKMVDHINKNSLDNRKINLRPADYSLNSRNRNLQSNNSSGMAGVTWAKNRNRWLAFTRIYGKFKHIGYYHTKEAAHLSRVNYIKINNLDGYSDKDCKCNICTIESKGQ